MDRNSKKIRSEAKFLVFAHLSKAILVYILSSIISTVIIYNMQLTVVSKNITVNTEKTALLVYGIMFVSLIANLPLTFCAHRFYLILSRHMSLEPIPIKVFFEPFQTPMLLLKGTLVILLTLVLELFGFLIFIIPIYLAFFPAVYVLSDNPDYSVFKAMKESSKIMKGNKWFAFKTLLPLFVLYALAMACLSSFYFISFFANAVIQIMIYVAFAMIYEKSRQN